MLDDVAHEIWSAAQLLPNEGIEDGVDRIKMVIEELTQQTNNKLSTKCLCETCHTVGCRGVDIPFDGIWTVHECNGFTQDVEAHKRKT